MFDHCVCFGLLFTLDYDLDHTFILPYWTLSSADASYPLIPINGLLHVGLKPSIYGRTARLWTECTQPGECLSHSLFQHMYVRAAAERSLSGTPIHLLLVDAPNRAISMDGMFRAGLQPLRAFAWSYPMDEILWASGQYCGPMDWILNETLRALMDQTQLCCKKLLRSSQHYPCCWATINLKPRIHHPRCYSSHAYSTPVAPTADSKRHTLLSALVWPFSELLPPPFHKTLTLQAWFWPSGALLSQTTLSRSFLRENIVPPFLDDLSTVWRSGDPWHKLHIFCGGLFLLGPYSLLQI